MIAVKDLSPPAYLPLCSAATECPVTSHILAVSHHKLQFPGNELQVPGHKQQSQVTGYKKATKAKATHVLDIVAVIVLPPLAPVDSRRLCVEPRLPELEPRIHPRAGGNGRGEEDRNPRPRDSCQKDKPQERGWNLQDIGKVTKLKLLEENSDAMHHAARCIASNGAVRQSRAAVWGKEDCVNECCLLDALQRLSCMRPPSPANFFLFPP